MAGAAVRAGSAVLRRLAAVSSLGAGREAYLDHAATTPMHPLALEAMARELTRTGNPSSLHAAGRAARRVVEESRERIAAALGADPGEVLLTSGGTEADNLAVKGIAWARRRADPAARRLLVSAVEHHAVLDPARWLVEHEGASLVELPVDRDGVLALGGLARALDADDAEGAPALVSVMWANNETGAVQPVRGVVGLAHERGVPVHVDAVQSVGTLRVDLQQVAADAVSVSAHKVGGPVGIGALVARRGLALEPVLHGGGHERGVRSGTLPAAAAAGFAAALEAAVASREAEARRLEGLCERLVEGVRATVPDAVLQGPRIGAAGEDGGPARLPGIALWTFPGCDGDSLIYLLDTAGVRCSTGAACTAGVAQPSHVLLASGLGEEQARGALRLSLGRTSTEADVDHVLAVLPDAVARARRAGLA